MHIGDCQGLVGGGGEMGSKILIGTGFLFGW